VHTPQTIAVVGHGLIADAIAAALRGSANAPRLGGDPPGRGECDGLIVASDCWDLAGYAATHDRCSSFGIPWMPVHVEFDVAIVGPVTRPSRPGCPACLRARRENNSPDNAARLAVQAANATALAATPSAALSPLAAGLIGTVATTEFLGGPGDGAQGSALFVRLDDLSVERHWFLPDPMCAACGRLPVDAAQDARIALLPRPKGEANRYRLWSAAEHGQEIQRAYVDPEAGLIHEVVRSDDCGLPVAEATVTLRVPGARVPGGGRSWDYTTSESVAVLESLERCGGANPSGRRTAVRAAMADLGEPALDPRRLGMHEDALYDRMPHLYQPFTEDSVCNWVWGYSLTAGHPVLVPETCAYFYTLNRPDPAFFAENTNGCALGSCLEEAILSGILEVAERDALLLTWHARLPATLVDLADGDDRDAAITAAAITQTTGYTVQLFDITTEVGIPCVWALATHPGVEDGTLGPGTDELAFFCAAGSSLVPERAALAALLELGPQLVDAVRRYPARSADAASFLRRPEGVRTIFDHAVAFGDPRAYERLRFLTPPGAGAKPIGAVGGTEAWPENSDLRDDLLEMVARFRREGMEIIVVDQTSDEHRAIGLHSVKVLIPGMLPLTYGHWRRRLRNLPRLSAASRRLGHASAPLSAADINQLPHPFAA
jgi:ribosomal protein S12 methylthiotransferase accessory factor